jgi:hypothetical protein
MHQNQVVATAQGWTSRLRQKQAVLPLTREWTVYGWIAADLLVFLSLLFPVAVQRSPIINGSGDPVSKYVTSAFDAWGGITVDPVVSASNLQRSGFPNYGTVLIPCMVLLLVAIGSILSPSRQRRFVWAAPMAASCLAGVGACQFLAYQAVSHISTSNTDSLNIPQPSWQLGASPLLITAGSIVALVTWQAHDRPASLSKQAVSVIVGPSVHETLASGTSPATAQRSTVHVVVADVADAGGAVGAPRHSTHASRPSAEAPASREHVRAVADLTIFQRPT